MPLKYSPRKPSETRPKVYALLAALLVLSAAALSGGGASAQRRNDNSSQQQQQGRSSRRVIVGRGSETSSGSRTTITADDSLNDYSAYRSGDRFYVVLPKSAAGAVSKGSGKGYTDVQVQQRGDSVVVSYKVQPGAKPRVEQKFNRLDVVFDVKDGGQPTPSGQQTAGASQTPAAVQNGNPGASEQQQPQAAQPRPTSTPAAGSERRPAEAAPNAGLPAASNPSNNAAQTGAAQTQPAPSPAGGQPSAESGAPAAAPTAEPQLAQNQPPAPVAPITKPNSPNAGAQAGVSFGTMLVNNWPVALLAALLVVGLGLVVFARRSTGHAPAELEAPEGLNAAAALEEPRAARLKESSTAGVVSVAEKTSTPAEASTPVATVAPLVTTAALAPGKKDKKKKKNRKGKAVESRAEGLPLAEAEPAEEPSVAAPPAEVVAAPAVEAAVEEAPAAEAEASVAETPTAEAEAATVEAAAVTPAQPAEASTQAAEDSTRAAEEVSETDAAGLVAAGLVTAAAGVVAAEASTAESVAEPVTESVAEPVAESAVEPAESAIEPVAASVVEPLAGPVTSIAPAAAPASEEVQAQTRRLLEGESYERSVIGSEDSMARQMIGAELLSALAGRNAERRERARAAFVEHGYFDEKARDVREAAAPAERAAAARSLAIVGDRDASPHLVAALVDESTEVRRAAVEALGALREPSAVEPLEALLLREKSQRNRIPTRIIQHAIETCRLAAVEDARAAERARAETAAAAATAAAEAAEAETIETKAVEPQVEEALAQVEEVAPLVEEAALGEEVSAREVGVAPAAASEEVVAGETAIVAAPDEAEASAAEAAAPFETELTGVEAAAAEARPVVEIEPAAEARPEEAQPTAGEAPALEESALEDEAVTSSTHAAESNAVEPFFASQPQAFEPAVAEPQVAEETRGAAEASSAETAEDAGGKSLAPFVSSDAPEEPARAGEWIELDMSDIRAAEPAAAVAEPQPTELLFESSAGESLSSAGVAEPEEQTLAAEPFTFETAQEAPTVETAAEASVVEAPVEPPAEAVTAPLPGIDEKGVVPFNERSMVPAAIQQRLTSRDAFVRAAAITELSHVDTDEAFQQICAGFDDEAKEVRSAAARALYELRTDRAESFTRALREAGPDRRRNVGAAISSSGLAGEAISQLTGESRDKTYEAFSLLFLMAKAGEVQPLVRAIEGHPNNEVRLAVVKLLALSGQKEILPAFRRLAVRGSLPTEVRSAVMEAIYQISSSNQPTPA